MASVTNLPWKSQALHPGIDLGDLVVNLTFHHESPWINGLQAESRIALREDLHKKCHFFFPQTLYRLGMVRMARGVPADFPQVWEGSPVHNRGVPVSEFAVCFMEFEGRKYKEAAFWEDALCLVSNWKQSSTWPALGWPFCKTSTTGFRERSLWHTEGGLEFQWSKRVSNAIGRIPEGRWLGMYGSCLSIRTYQAIYIVQTLANLPSCAKMIKNDYVHCTCSVLCSHIYTLGTFATICWMFWQSSYGSGPPKHSTRMQPRQKAWFQPKFVLEPSALRTQAKEKQCWAGRNQFIWTSDHQTPMKVGLTHTT